MNISNKDRGLDGGAPRSGGRGTNEASARGLGHSARGAGRRATDNGNPGTFVGTEARQGVWYARYRAKQGTWVSSSLAQLGYDKEFGKDVAYGAYLGVARAPNGHSLETPDKIKPGQEYLIPIGTAGKLEIPASMSEDLPPNGLRSTPTESERGTQPVPPRVYSGPSLPPWVKPDQVEAIKELARRREVRNLQSKSHQPTGRQGPDTSESGFNEYHYHRDVVIGNTSEHSTATPPLDQLVMWALQAKPNRFFPFSVIPLHGERGIELNGEYNLDASFARGNWSRLSPFSGPYPVRVTEVSPRSFTFTTLPGHFDPAGSTIRFSTYLDAAGNIHFVHDANTKQSPDFGLTGLAAPTDPSLWWVWDTQEDRVRSWLRDIP